jgi:uncharacterized membrane protein YphA (DoxX/SURF4 family)
MQTMATQTNTLPVRRSPPKWIWVLQILAALAFIYVGGLKLAGTSPELVQLFDKIGIGQWFRYLTGGLEVIGAIALLVPKSSGFGALLLSCVMAGAVIIHLFVVGGTPVPAIVLLAITSLIAWLRLRK